MMEPEKSDATRLNAMRWDGMGWDGMECGETSASAGKEQHFYVGFDETTTTTTSLEPFLPFQLEKQSPSAILRVFWLLAF